MCKLSMEPLTKVWYKTNYSCKSYFLKEISTASIDPKMTLKHQRLNLPHIYALPTPEAQVFIHFALSLAISNIFAKLHIPIGHSVTSQSVFLAKKSQEIASNCCVHREHVESFEITRSPMHCLTHSFIHSSKFHIAGVHTSGRYLTNTS